jgi:ABC-2 type transport system permease protein
VSGHDRIFDVAEARDCALPQRCAIDTIAPPTISIVLFLLIFGVGLGPRLGDVHGVPYIQFMMPGLLLLAIVRNAFLNPAYSLFQSRWFGNIADFLVSPLAVEQIALAILLGGVARGCLSEHWCFLLAGC